LISDISLENLTSFFSAPDGSLERLKLAKCSNSVREAFTYCSKWTLGFEAEGSADMLAMSVRCGGVCFGWRLSWWSNGLRLCKVGDGPAAGTQSTQFQAQRMVSDAADFLLTAAKMKKQQRIWGWRWAGDGKEKKVGGERVGKGRDDVVDVVW
jgi:hypothetical protein